MKKAIGAISSVIAVFLILAMTLPVSAGWNSDIGGGTAVTITDSDPFTIDTFLGITAYYSEKSSKYTASELVVRFYKDDYGLDVSTSGGPTITSTGYEFKIPATPQNGDVVYSEEGHWAIVKSYNKSKGIITIFEQGNAQDGKVYKNRTLKYPSDSYTVYTPRSKTGYSYPVLKDHETQKKVTVNRVTVYDITEAASETETTAAPSQAQTTAKSSDKKTTAAGTTKAGKEDKTTEAETEVTTLPAFTTYVGESNAQVVEGSTFTTSAMPSGYEQFFTSGTDQGEYQYDSGDGAYDPNQSTQGYYDSTQVYDENGNILETTEEETDEEKDKSVNPTLIFGIAMVGGIVLITVAGIVAGLVIKKRSEEY